MANRLGRTGDLVVHAGLAIVAVFLISVALNAGGQSSCTSGVNTSDTGSWPGSILQLTAITTSSGVCSARTNKVSGWIDGVPTDCQTDGDLEDEGPCYASKLGEAASVRPTGIEPRCGEWDGYSSHQYYESGQDHTIQSNRHTLLRVTPCEDPEDPEEDDPNDQEDQCSDPVECNQSPIIISTGKGAAYKLTSAAQGVWFDINGDGVLDRVAWTPPASDIAFLAIDRNGDGQINDGKELFGNNTYPGVPHGFEALKKMNMETNGGRLKGSVNGEDPLFTKLLLWNDANHNGVSEPYELTPASSVLSAIGLGYQPLPRRDGHGNTFRFRGWVHIRTQPGLNKSQSEKDNKERTRHIWDVFFQVAK